MGDRTKLSIYTKESFYLKYVKRFFDIFLSLLAIILLSPLLIIISVLVRIKIGRPIIFKQERPGLNEKIFTLYKFRTMTDDRNSNGELLPDRFRLTKFGKLLRSTSLDELPELINILKGDMSFIGPRPLLVEYLPLYNDYQKRRHCIRPGLSGAAQVHGRNSLSWDDKFKYDINYVDKVTFVEDCKIIFLTFKIVIMRHGINSETSVTMEPFTGNNNGNK